MSLHEKPIEKNFIVKAVKSTDRSSLDITAHAIKVDGPHTHEVPYSGTYEIVPHPDLITKLEELKPTLAQYFDYTSFKSVVKEERFKANKAQIKHTEEYVNQLLSNIKVTGMSLSGSDLDKVTIKGTYNGCSINTKPIHFSSETYDGEKLEEICKDLKAEVYAYLFDDKKQQLDLAFQEPESEGEPLLI